MKCCVQSIRPNTSSTLTNLHSVKVFVFCFCDTPITDLQPINCCEFGVVCARSFRTHSCGVGQWKVVGGNFVWDHVIILIGKNETLGLFFSFRHGVGSDNHRVGHGIGI